MHFRPWPLPSGGFLKKPADKVLIFLLKTIYFIIKILNLHHYFTPNFFLVDLDYFDTVICIPNQVFYGDKTTYICYNPISPQICFDSPVCQDFMKIFYLPNVFVKIVKVNKTNQNMFESSHKTSLVSKICTNYSYN